MLALRRGSRRLELVAQQRGTLDSGRSGRRDDVAVVPADAKSIATSPAWRNPPLSPPFQHPARERFREVRAESLLFAGWAPLLHPRRRFSIHPASWHRWLT